MNFRSIFFAIFGVAISLNVRAGELNDCQISMLGTPPKYVNQARFFLEVSGELKNGTENTYQHDDPILNSNIRIVRTLPAITPNSDVILKSSFPLVAGYSFAKGAPLRIFNEAIFSDGRKFGVIEGRGPMHIFFNENIELCNKAYLFKGATTSTSLGTFSQMPDDAHFERSTQDDVVKSGSLRLIYLGTTAGALRIAEVWVQGSKITRSITRTFDQFAKTIDVAGFKFEIVEAKGESLRLRYEIPSRTEINPRVAADTPL